MFPGFFVCLFLDKLIIIYPVLLLSSEPNRCKKKSSHPLRLLPCHTPPLIPPPPTYLLPCQSPLLLPNPVGHLCHPHPPTHADPSLSRASAASSPQNRCAPLALRCDARRQCLRSVGADGVAFVGFDAEPSSVPTRPPTVEDDAASAGTGGRRQRRRSEREEEEACYRRKVSVWGEWIG